MISTNELKNGYVIEVDGVLSTVVEFQHVKPGKGGAFVRTKLKNIRTGAVIDRTYSAGERVTDVRLEDDTVVVTLSEFGRTSKENGSFGTDHAEGLRPRANPTVDTQAPVAA